MSSQLPPNPCSTSLLHRGHAPSSSSLELAPTRWVYCFPRDYAPAAHSVPTAPPPRQATPLASEDTLNLTYFVPRLSPRPWHIPTTSLHPHPPPSPSGCASLPLTPSYALRPFTPTTLSSHSSFIFPKIPPPPIRPRLCPPPPSPATITVATHTLAPHSGSLLLLTCQLPGPAWVKAAASPGRPPDAHCPLSAWLAHPAQAHGYSLCGLAC